jgi:dihydroxy-acid dehydratase
MTRNGLRSSRWFGGDDLTSLIHRSAIRAEGFSSEVLDGRPVIGICNSWSELVNCNFHFRAIAQNAKRGVLRAGGLPLEFPTISLGEQLMKPTTMLYRNLMAMDVEESLRAYPLDAVVLIGGCDKTVPAQLMGATSAGVPAIMVTGGPAQAAVFRGRDLGVGTDLWRYLDDYRAGRMSEREFSELEAALGPSVGHCNEMGTALTMTSLVEALGMTLPGSASIPAVDARRYSVAEEAGARAVEIARSGPAPAEILTAKAFDNAITLLMALGGSTNAVIHLLALAGRAGVELRLERFNEISARTPVLANLRPSGEHLAEQLHRAGGVPALLRELRPLLNDTATIAGVSLFDAIADAPEPDGDVIARLSAPLRTDGAIVALHGSLAPDGAIIKVSAATERLLRHRGRAVVFDGMEDLLARIDDPDLDVDADSVLVLRNAGPIGAPGMPEWGALPIPRKLLREGVEDMVRISDARMSGTAFGTVVLHVAPEAAAGGPLAIVRDGDSIALDVPGRSLGLDLPQAQIEERLGALQSPEALFSRGYGAIYCEHVLQADRGCDFDFLVGRRGERPNSEPVGMVTGWIGGW